MKKMRIGAVLAAGLMALSFAGTVLAAGSGTVDWNGLTVGGGWPVTENCSDTQPGEILWIYTGDSSEATPVLTVSGVEVAQSAVHKGGANGSWHIITAWPDQRPVAPTFITYFGAGGGNLVISHGCSATTTTTTETTETTQTTETTETTQTTETTETTQTTDSTTESTTTDTTTTDSTSSETTDTTTTNTPTGTVAAETGTPPATDASINGGSNSASTGSWNLLLAAGVLLTLSILVLTPATKGRRNK